MSHSLLLSPASVSSVHPLMQFLLLVWTGRRQVGHFGSTERYVGYIA
ncbi:hypothetical protein [Bacteroides luhongzhouii]|nr:hypothetical protein [Bacteroides luhongzhouii]